MTVKEFSRDNSPSRQNHVYGTLKERAIIKNLVEEAIDLSLPKYKKLEQINCLVEPNLLKSQGALHPLISSGFQDAIHRLKADTENYPNLLILNGFASTSRDTLPLNLSCATDKRPITTNSASFDLHNQATTKPLEISNFLPRSKMGMRSLSQLSGLSTLPFPHKKNSYKDAPKLITCPINGCNQKFPWNSSLKRHILTHTPHKPFACTRCTKSFSTKSNRERHMERVHQVSLKRQRQRTQTIIATPGGHKSDTNQLVENYSDLHIKTSLNNPPKQPALTGLEELREDEILSMNSNEKQAEDISNSLLNNAGEPVVEPNPERFYTAALMAAANAAASSTGVNDDELAVIREKLFQESKDYLLPRNVQNRAGGRAGRKPRKLDQNDVPTRNYDMIPLPTNVNEYEPPIDLSIKNATHTLQCSICSALVASRYFRRHVSQHATETPLFRCHLCQLPFDTRVETLQHWFVVHKEQWQKFINNKIRMNDNQFTLNMTVPDQQENRFQLKESLHEPEVVLDSYSSSSSSSKPSELKYITCCVCLHRFGSQQDLQRHMRSHTGERPFICPDCGKEFSLKHSMHRHYRVHVKQHIDQLSNEQSSNPLDIETTSSTTK